MKTIRQLLVVSMVLFALPAFAQELEKDPPLPTMDEVTKKLDDLYRAESSHATMKMIVVNKRGTRELTLESWSKGQDTSLILIRKPAREAGTATLLTEEGLWTYAPRADRLIRMPKGLLSDSWMGSDFTNDDLVRDSRYEDDFDSTLAWVKEDGKRLLLVTLIPKKGAPVVFTKLEYRLTPDDLVPVRADYYDGKKLTRLMKFSDVREISGKKVPFKMELLPQTKKKNSTTVIYESLEFDAKVDEKIFTKQGLRRVAKSK